MGIAGLIQFLKNASSEVNLDKFTDTTGVVDVSHWIYKACYACPELVYHRQDLAKVHSVVVSFCMSYVNLLRSHNIDVIFVFDGLKLPAKKATHEERRQKRQECKENVEKLLKKGNIKDARALMCRCIEVRFDIVKAVIDMCRRERIEYYVAPYEADAQIAYLCNNGYVDFVITEDADLILYGCQKILFKLDRNTGYGLLVERSKLKLCFSSTHSGIDHFQAIRRIAILSGCDYLKNIPGVGLKTALKFFTTTRRNTDLKTLLKKLNASIPKKSIKVTDEYIEGFIDAENTFKYHIVYCPKTSRLRPLEPYLPGHSSRDYPSAGKLFDSDFANQLARGKINIDLINYEQDIKTIDDVCEDESMYA